MCKFNNNKHRIYLDELLGTNWDLTGQRFAIYIYICIYMYDHILYNLILYIHMVLYIYIHMVLYIYIYVYTDGVVYIYIQKCNIYIYAHI